MLLMLGRFVCSKVKSGLVQKLALAVVLNWAALVTMTMTSNLLIIRHVRCGAKAIASFSGLSLRRNEASKCSCCSTMTPNLPTRWVTAAIPARAVGMAATANKRHAQIGRARSLRCWDIGGTAEKGVILAELDLLIFAF
jgi:hypothetical protein